MKVSDEKCEALKKISFSFKDLFYEWSVAVFGGFDYFLAHEIHNYEKGSPSLWLCFLKYRIEYTVAHFMILIYGLVSEFW